MLHEKTYKIRVFWKVSEPPQSRCREIQASPLPHFIIQVPVSFAELNQASEVAAARIPVPSSCSPYHRAPHASLTPQLQGEARQQGWGEPNRLGKTQNCPVTLDWVVCPTWSHPATESSATSPQPLAHKAGDLFLPPLGSAEQVIQILQHPGSERFWYARSLLAHDHSCYAGFKGKGTTISHILIHSGKHVHANMRPRTHIHSPSLSGAVWMGPLHKSTCASQKRNPDSIIHWRWVEQTCTHTASTVRKQFPPMMAFPPLTYKSRIFPDNQVL